MEAPPFIYQQLEAALIRLASDAEVQRAFDFPPEEMRLEWADALALVEDHALLIEHDRGLSAANMICAFNDYLWQLPPEPDSMWNRDNLGNCPWPEVRRKASVLLGALRSNIPS